LVGWLADQLWAMRAFDRLNKKALEKLRKELEE
jgi:hypothetical protein